MSPRWTSIVRAPALRLGLCLLMGGAAAFLSGRQSFRALEHRLYDMRAQWAASRHVPIDRIMIVAIDNASMAHLEPAVGRWPWPRAVYAGILDFCSAARVIGMDILFPEADWQYPGSDDLLVTEARDYGRLVTAVFLTSDPTDPTASEKLAAFSLPSLAQEPSLFERRSALLPYASLLASSKAVGHVNFDSDEDGTVRNYLVVAGLDGRILPSLALSVALQSGGVSQEDVRIVDGRLEAGPLSVRVQPGGRMLLCPGLRPHTTVSVADVLDAWKGAEVRGPGGKALTRETFRDKLVLIGSLATGLQADQEVTPLASHVAGIAITATALDNILTGTTYRVLPNALLLLLVLLLALIPGAIRLDRPAYLAAAGVLTGTVYVGAALGLLLLHRIMLPLSPPLAGLLLSCIALGLAYWYEERRRRRRLEDLERAKQGFTDMLVHDLKGRVASITMSTSMIEQVAENLPADRRTVLAIMKTTTERLLMDINALLDIRKMEEGRLHLHRSRLDVCAAVRATAHSLAHAAAVSDVELQVPETACPPIPVDADSDILDRVLSNLVWNAIEHAPVRSTIDIRCEREGSSAVITIANLGPAIPPEDLAQVFQPFVSLGRRKKRAMPGGTGLGLAFCRLAVETHGGTLSIESPWHEGQGVRVRIVLPQAPLRN